MRASPVDRWRVLSRRNTKRYGNHDRRRRVEVILGRSQTDPQNSGTTDRIHALVSITGDTEVGRKLESAGRGTLQPLDFLIPHNVQTRSVSEPRLMLT